MLQKDTTILLDILLLLDGAGDYVLSESDGDFIGDCKTYDEAWHFPPSRFPNIRNLSNQESIKLKNLFNKIEREIT